MPVPGATIRAMPGDLEPVPARVVPPAPGAGPAVLAAELFGRVRAELPAVVELGSGSRSWWCGPSASKILQIFADVTRHELHDQHGNLIQAFEPQLNDLQRQVLELLEIPETAFTATAD